MLAFEHVTFWKLKRNEKVNILEEFARLDLKAAFSLLMARG